MTTGDQSVPPKSSQWLLAMAVMYAVVVLFVGLGVRGLNEPDEGRYAEEAREMLARLQMAPQPESSASTIHRPPTGAMAWLEATLDGEPYYSKPPLTNWLTCATMSLVGLNEWGARMPAALAALGAVLVAMTLARRMGGEEFGQMYKLELKAA